MLIRRTGTRAARLRPSADSSWRRLFRNEREEALKKDGYVADLMGSEVFSCLGMNGRDVLSACG